MLRPIEISQPIDSAAETVFATVSRIANYAQANPKILRYEILTDSPWGVGSRFRETRLMGEREVTTELEVTEFEPPSRVRMVSAAGGTIWDSIFSIEPQQSGCSLTLSMEARPFRLLPRLMNRLIRGMIVKAVAEDLQAVRQFCESSS